MSTEDESMDKYAVDEQLGLDSENLEKRAQKGCPSCGRELTRHGNVLVCPEHGTEPFEG